MVTGGLLAVEAVNFAEDPNLWVSEQRSILLGVSSLNRNSYSAQQGQAQSETFQSEKSKFSVSRLPLGLISVPNKWHSSSAQGCVRAIDAHFFRGYPAIRYWIQGTCRWVEPLYGSEIAHKLHIYLGYENVEVQPSILYTMSNDKACETRTESKVWRLRMRVTVLVRLCMWARQVLCGMMLELHLRFIRWVREFVGTNVI